LRAGSEQGAAGERARSQDDDDDQGSGRSSRESHRGGGGTRHRCRPKRRYRSFARIDRQQRIEGSGLAQARVAAGGVERQVARQAVARSRGEPGGEAVMKIFHASASLATSCTRSLSGPAGGSSVTAAA